MSPKPGFWEDTFEKLAELGTTTVKKTGQAVKQTVSPTKMIEKVLDTEPDRGMEQLEKSQAKKKTHTPLDFEKLQKQYKNQDGQKTALLRQRLFQLVKSGEEKILMEKKQEELEKKRKEAYEEEERKRKEEEKKKREAASIPMGKIRRSIFTPLKIAKRQTAEVRPATGKQ